MKITELHVSGLYGAREIHLADMAPITLLAGANGAGKTSVVQAIHLMCTGELARVSLKKDAKAIIHDEAKNGAASLEFADQPAFTAAVSKSKVLAPAAAHVDTPAMRVCIGHTPLPALSAQALRGMLFALTETKVDAKSISQLLVQRGHDQARVSRVAPVLRAGFPEAAAVARDAATEARGAWRAVTGETYGAEKAKEWAAHAPKVDPEETARLQRDLASVDESIERANRAIGAERTRQQQATASAQRAQQLRDIIIAADGLTARSAEHVKQAEELRAQLAEANAKAGIAPVARVGWVHDAAAALAWHSDLECIDVTPELDEATADVLAAYEAKHGAVPRPWRNETPAHDPEAAAQAERLAGLVKDAEAIVAADEAQARVAAQAAADLAAMGDAGMTLEQAEQVAGNINRAEALLAGLKAEREPLHAAITERLEKARVAIDAQRKTEDAAAHHADAAAWVALETALSPEGIPNELLAGALGPVNEMLSQYAADTGWPLAAIGPDMDITYGGRPFALLSKGESWRCNAMLAATVSTLSKARILVLDEFDLIQPDDRGNTLAWLGILADNDEIDSCIVLGTLASLPAETQLPPGVRAEWIANGRCGEQPPEPTKAARKTEPEPADA